MRATLVGCALALVACTADGAEPTRPNFVLVSIDTLRADHLGSYGYERPTSPHLDHLAAEGVVYERAWAQSPWTLPSHASLLTGLYTRGHGLRDDGQRLSREIPVLTESMAKEGYRVGAIVGSHYLLPRTGLVRIAELFRYFRMTDDDGGRAFTADAQVDAAIEFIAQKDPRPFFLLLHNYDVHSDYAPGDESRSVFVDEGEGGSEGAYDGPLDGTTKTLLRVRRGELEASPDDIAHVVDLYDAVIRQLDASLGRLFAHLEEAGIAGRTVVVVTSDHGEEFLEHGNVLHGLTVYEEMLHVPLIWRGPGVPAGRRIAAPTSLVDVMPTLLGMAGIAPRRPLDGRDLSGDWQEEGPPATRPIFAEVDARRVARTPSGDLTAVRLGNLKLIHDRARNLSKLFDLSIDPGEQTDLAEQRPVDRSRLAAEVVEHRAQAVQPGAGGSVTQEERELLRRLGYAD